MQKAKNEKKNYDIERNELPLSLCETIFFIFVKICNMKKKYAHIETSFCDTFSIYYFSFVYVAF